MTVPVLINSMDRGLPKVGPIFNSIHSKHQMTPRQIAMYERMAAFPNPKPKDLFEIKSEPIEPHHIGKER